MATIATLLIDLGMNVARLQKDVGEASRVVDRGVRDMQRSITSLKAAFEGVLVGSGALMFGRAMTREVSEAEQASNRLTAVLRATGNAAGLTKQELDDLAEAMANSTQFDDESIRGAEATLLKFGNITGGVFRESLKLSADLAAFMGTNIPEAAQLLGKSVQSPTEGLTMMERQFGKLTDAEEGHIKTLARQGKAIEAQNAVLDLWRNKIGGTSDLMNTGMTQASKDLGKEWNELLETLGKTPEVGGRIENSMRGLTDILRDLRNEITGVRTPLSGLIKDTLDLMGHLPGVFGLGARLQRMGAERLLPSGGVGGGTALADWMEPGPASNVPVTLGGAMAGGMKTEEILKRQLESMEAFNEEVRKGNAELNEFLDKPKLEGLNKVLAEQAGIWMDIDENIARAVMSGKAFEEENLATRRETLQLTKEQKQLASDLAMTFSSAFEDAVVKGNSFRDVLQGIYQDILRILVRTQITQPMANWLGGVFSGAIGGGVGGGGAGPKGTVSSSTFVIDARGADAAGLARLERAITRLNGSIEPRAVAAVFEEKRRTGGA